MMGEIKPPLHDRLVESVGPEKADEVLRIVAAWADDVSSADHGGFMALLGRAMFRSMAKALRNPEVTKA